MKKKIICFDIDNVICTTKKNLYKKSTPKKNVILEINKLYEAGYFIKLFTSRYMGRSKENRSIATKKAKTITTKQLKIWGVKFHELIFGKPSYDVFVDDKAITFDKMWVKNLNEISMK
jgi:CMP-N,N'-diacetyllegionaminic acid synthase